MIRTYFACFLIVFLAAGDLLDKEPPPQSRWDLSTFRQELPDQINQDAYIQEFMKIIQRWNTEVIEFPSYGTMHAHYKANLDQAVEQKWHSYANIEWAEAKLKQFDQLANTPSRPKLKLDREAALTLTLAFAINLTSIRSKYKAESLDKELTIPSYIIFTESQKLALKDKRSFITSEDVSRTIFRWWTTVWPFCAPPEKET